MPLHGKFIELPAVEGLQAGKPYYIAMCPLGLVAQIFTYTDSSLPSEMRIQRTLNKQRIPEIKDYILQNRDSYVFSALTASVDGEINFVSRNKESVGNLQISLDSRIIINDGQHRRAAIEEALKECPDLRYEDISIVLYYDLGLKRSQQMFTDLNRYAIRPTQSLNILYDNRDVFALLVKECISEIPIFHNSVENEKSTISNRSNKLFTLSGIFSSTRLLLKGIPLDEKKYKEVIISFWKAVANHMPIWQQAKDKVISPEIFRHDYVCAHTITLKALAELGNSILANRPSSPNFNKHLKFLSEIDWKKSNKKLQGIVITNGKISSSYNNQRAFADFLMQCYKEYSQKHKKGPSK
jgi:DNA sulfur modification protein DndB